MISMITNFFNFTFHGLLESFFGMNRKYNIHRLPSSIEEIHLERLSKQILNNVHIPSDDGSDTDVEVFLSDGENSTTDSSDLQEQSDKYDISIYKCLKEDRYFKNKSEKEQVDITIDRISERLGFHSFITDTDDILLNHSSETNINLGDLYSIYFDKEKIKKYCNKEDSLFENMTERLLSNNSSDIEKYKLKFNCVEPTLDNVRHIMELFNVPTKEKDDRAHVMTPIYMVKGMMQNIPIKFWKNKNKRVLDPCCGYGVFILCCFMIFNDILYGKIPDNEERVRWIVENCLFFSDLVRYNVKVTEFLLQFFCNQIVGKKVTGLRFNSFVGNVLTILYPNHFDLITTNPPFHKKQNNGGKKGGGDALWDKIVLYCVEKLLEPKGYLLVVHPAGWRKPKSLHSKFTEEFYDLYTKDYQLLYLEIHDTKAGQKAFNCGTRYDIVLLEKTLPYRKTVTVDEKGFRSQINLKQWPWLPNSNFQQIKPLFAKKNESKTPLIYNRTNYGSDKKYVVSKKTSINKYPLVHSTPKKGRRMMYSSRNDLGHYGQPKVIFGDSAIHNPIIDMRGEYGMTQHAMAISVSNLNEAKAIKKALESPEFKSLLQSCSWSNFQIDWRMFKSFKKDWYKNFA